MKKEIFAVGNAHLDPVWLWQWGEGLQAARATFQSALDRIAEHDEFVFTCAGSGIYQWIEITDPQMFREIQRAVEEGRWVLVGGWWLQPDCNIPSGESFVRHSLYGQRYLLEKFGRCATVGYNVDSFGHSWSLPQILRKSGMDSYVFMRPGPHENPDIPGRLFRWEGLDGSSVLAFQIPYQYNLEGERLAQRWEDIVEEANDQQPMMLFYGVGNHGGGPTKASIAFLDEKKKGDEVSLRFSSPEEYFARVRKLGITPPVYPNELQHHASGCYSVHSEIKRDNRQAEAALEAAEKWAVIAAANTEYAYPAQELTRAWQGVLFNQFHDIMAGTSLESAYIQAKNLHGYALQLGDEVGEFARQAIAGQIDTTRQEGVPLILWNSTSWPRTEVVTAELQWREQEIEVVDLEGNPIPTQVMAPEAAIAPGSRVKIAFPATVPALGYRGYWAVPKVRTTGNDPSAVIVRTNGMENQYLRVEFDVATGALISLFDKTLGLEMLASPGRAVVCDDDSDTWSHGVFSFPNQVGQFDGAEVRIMEAGPVRGRIRIITKFQNSTLRQDYILAAGCRYLDCQATIDWREQHQLMKLTFPVNVTEPTATYEIAYGHITRPCDGEEEPGQRWVDLTGTHRASGTTCGLTLANDCKYSFDITDSEIRMTVLRSPAYAHHIPRRLEPGDEVEYIDQGQQRFAYRLLPHRGGISSGEFSAPRAGVELNSPLVVREDYRHSGPLAPEASFGSTSQPQVHLAVVKQAEDGQQAIVIRAWETSGQDLAEPVAISVMGYRFTAKFLAHEIKTFLLSQGLVTETDLLERPLTD
ncbi:MAG: alpha-mannosidase [Firmicutes bacterium]|nr:alpha-mannosidase [Bacillota bacterium]